MKLNTDSSLLEERTLKTQELLNASIGELAQIMRENNRIGEITNKSMQMGKVDQGKTIGGMLGGGAAAFKDFFTARGFLEKTGMVQRGSGGLIDTALRKREERQEFIEARKLVDPNMKNMKQFGGSERKLDAYLGSQFDKSRAIRLEMQENQKKVSQLQELGFTEQQIARSAPGKAQAGLEAKLSQVDTRFRQNDLKVPAAKKPGTSDQNESPVKKILKRDDLTTNEEEKENMAWKDQQLDTLADIRDNTANMSELLADMFSLDKKESREASKESKPGGIFSGLKGMLSGAGAAGGGLLRGAGGKIGSFLGGTGGKLLGAAGLIGMAGFNAYQDFGDINEKLARGEITESEATVEKGAATGKAAGTVGGGLAGAKLGAMAGAAIGSVVPGIGTAIGGLVGSIIGGIGGAFAGSKFGQMVGRVITEGGMQLFSLADKYIIEPIKNIGTYLGNMFNEYIYQPLGNAMTGLMEWWTGFQDDIKAKFDEYIYEPLATALQPITDWFTQMFEDLKAFFHDIKIPGISIGGVMGIPEYTFGPWYPFRSEETAEGAANPDANDPRGDSQIPPVPDAITYSQAQNMSNQELMDAGLLDFDDQDDRNMVMDELRAKEAAESSVSAAAMEERRRQAEILGYERRGNFGPSMTEEEMRRQGSMTAMPTPNPELIRRTSGFGADTVMGNSAANASARDFRSSEPPKVVVQNNNNTEAKNTTIASAHRSRNDEGSIGAHFARNSLY